MDWPPGVEPYSRLHDETLADVRDNLRLKRYLKRAVEREVAPLSLIQSIKDQIRK
jgi:hypothetical protein